jgi:hypothetical protein
MWLKLKVTQVHGHDGFISFCIPKALFPFFYLLVLAALVLHLPLYHNNITVTLAEMGFNVNFVLIYFILDQGGRETRTIQRYEETWGWRESHKWDT